jgi:hypothetical protein
MNSTDVQISKPLLSAGVCRPRTRPDLATYEVRWIVAGSEFTLTAMQPFAFSFYSGLLAALDAGEAFDVHAAGLPESMATELRWRRSPATCLQKAAEFAELRRRTQSARAHTTMMRALTIVVGEAVKDRKPSPDAAALREAFTYWCARQRAEHDQGQREPGSDVPPMLPVSPRTATALIWLQRNSLPAGAIADPRVFMSIVTALGARGDGNVFDGDRGRSMAAFESFIQYLVEQRFLNSAPLTMRHGASVRGRRFIPQQRSGPGAQADIQPASDLGERHVAVGRLTDLLFCSHLNGDGVPGKAQVVDVVREAIATYRDWNGCTRKIAEAFLVNPAAAELRDRWCAQIAETFIDDMQIRLAAESLAER